MNRTINTIAAIAAIAVTVVLVTGVANVSAAMGSDHEVLPFQSEQCRDLYVHGYNGCIEAGSATNGPQYITAYTKSLSGDRLDRYTRMCEQPRVSYEDFKILICD